MGQVWPTLLLFFKSIFEDGGFNEFEICIDSCGVTVMVATVLDWYCFGIRLVMPVHWIFHGIDQNEAIH